MFIMYFTLLDVISINMVGFTIGSLLMHACLVEVLGLFSRLGLSTMMPDVLLQVAGSV